MLSWKAVGQVFLKAADIALEFLVPGMNHCFKKMQEQGFRNMNKCV